MSRPIEMTNNEDTVMRVEVTMAPDVVITDVVAPDVVITDVVAPDVVITDVVAPDIASAETAVHDSDALVCVCVR